MSRAPTIQPSDVPGRKTDVGDAQWLATLARAGLLRGSFVPPNVMRELRLIARQRQKLVGHCDVSMRADTASESDHRLETHPWNTAPRCQTSTCWPPSCRRPCGATCAATPATTASADDLLQETLLRMARGLPEFAGRATVKTWAFAIATHAAADHFRRPAYCHAIVDLDKADHVEDPGRAVDEQMVVNEMNACIRLVIDSLPANYRAALVLHDLEGLAAAVVADVCGVTLATAKIRIHRARHRLKDALAQQCAFYRDDEGVYRCDRKA